MAGRIRYADEAVNPARAGMIRVAPPRRGDRNRKPRAGGDDPILLDPDTGRPV